MIRNILVASDGSAYGDAACDYAIDLALRLKARLMAIHVLDARMLEGPLMADISGWLGAQAYGAQVQQFRELMESKGAAVLTAMEDRARKKDCPVECTLKTGLPARALIEEESRAELLVLGQRGEHSALAEDMLGSCADRVVRQSVKPCLVVPDTFRAPTRLLAAYDGSAHAGQALALAADLTLALGAELHIVTATEDQETLERVDEVAADARKQVAAHDCPAACHVVDGSSEEAVLGCAREHDCDLVVMGAYGHSRVREMILGSTTTAVMTRSHLPVMMVR